MKICFWKKKFYRFLKNTNLVIICIPFFTLSSDLKFVVKAPSFHDQKSHTLYSRLFTKELVIKQIDQNRALAILKSNIFCNLFDLN